MDELEKEYEDYMNQLYNLTKEQINALDESFCHWKHKALINYIYELQCEKQQLIKFLEDKIKEYNLCFPEVVKALQEVLDFVNKGVKNEI